MRRRPACLIVGAVFVAAIGTAACRRPAAPRAHPSIILISIDTLRADHVTPALMPALDAMGRNAVIFDQAITVAPLTLPAHASLLTGLYPPRHRVRDNQVFALPPDIVTYPSILKSRGYATGAFVSAVVLAHRYGLNRGFDVYDDAISGPERAAAETLARADRWIAGVSGPFFVWIHLFEPHAPYRTGSYANEVSAVDAVLGQFFGRLRESGRWNEAIVSVTADHGESLGEHGEQTHGFFVYDSTLRIPWILKAPGLAPRRVPSLVRIVDEMPTILDLAGVGDARNGAAAVDGVALRPLLRGGALGLEAYSETFLPTDQFGWSALASVRTDRLKFIQAPQPELYDLDRDPQETTNLASARPADASRLARIGSAIGASSPGPAAATPPVDPATAEQLMALGYIGHGAAPVSNARLADPKSKIGVYTLVMRALEQSEKGDVAGALGSLDKAEALDRDVAQIAFLKGTLLGRMGRFDAAASALERAVRLNPQDTAARFKLALAYVRLQRPDQAIAALEDVVRQQPDDFRAWHNLAAIAYTRGDLEAAERLERKALALSPDYAEAWNTLGAIALVRRRTSDALDALTKATQFGPRNAQAFDNLALAFRAAGEPDRARAAAQRACELDPRFCASGERR